MVSFFHVFGGPVFFAYFWGFLGSSPGPEKSVFRGHFFGFGGPGNDFPGLGGEFSGPGGFGRGPPHGAKSRPPGTPETPRFRKTPSQIKWNFGGTAISRDRFIKNDPAKIGHRPRLSFGQGGDPPGPTFLEFLDGSWSECAFQVWKPGRRVETGPPK